MLSHHHQGIAELGEGLTVTGRAVADGVIEAIEAPDRRFALGILWHAEEESPSPVIEALVAAARDGAGVAAVISVVEPATAEVIAEVPRAGVEEADPAIAAAHEAFPGWRAIAPDERSQLLHDLAERDRAPRARSWRCWRRGTRARRSATPAARSGWSSTPSASTRARRCG